MNKVYLSAIFALFLLVCSCSNQKTQPDVTPWGTPIGEEDYSSNSNQTQSFTYDDIVSNGELIMLTVNGPDTYYIYKNRNLGMQYLLCEKFAQKIGVSLRVEVCKDTTEMISKLEKGEGDIIAVPLSRKKAKGNLLFCGPKQDTTQEQWVVIGGNNSLADSLNAW